MITPNRARASQCGTTGATLLNARPTKGDASGRRTRAREPGHHEALPVLCAWLSYFGAAQPLTALSPLATITEQLNAAPASLGAH